MRRKIMRVLLQKQRRRNSSWNSNSFFVPQLSSMANCVERYLYNHSLSMSEYSNEITLDDRMTRLALMIADYHASSDTYTPAA